MNKVDQILKFIDGDTEQETPQEIPAPAPQGCSNEERPEGMERSHTEQETENYTDGVDKKDYSKIIRQIKKIKEYPTILKINNKNTIINNEEELNNIKQTLQQQHKEQLRKERQEKISKTPLKLKKMSSDDETIEDNEYIYKKPSSVYAIKKDGQKLKVPTTSPQDTKKIYKKVSENKENVKRLVKAKNKEEFNEITEDVINSLTDGQENNELRDIVFNHTHNDINKDRTWDKETLIKLLLREMQKTENTEKNNISRDSTRETHLNETRRSEFNPMLFKR